MIKKRQIFPYRFTHSLNGFAALALTKLDILDQLDELKICVNYLKNDQVMRHYPSSEQDFVGVSCEYITLPGWKSDITKCRLYEDLPVNAQSYIKKIEEVLQVPIWWIGVGQGRKEIVSCVPSGVTI